MESRGNQLSIIPNTGTPVPHIPLTSKKILLFCISLIHWQSFGWSMNSNEELIVSVQGATKSPKGGSIIIFFVTLVNALIIT